MRILLIDDHTLFRESLKRLLETEAGWQVVGDFGHAEAALHAVREGLACDLALIDFDLGAGSGAAHNGLQVSADLRKLQASLPILLVTAGMEERQLLEAVQGTRVGVFLKSEPVEELILAMRRTAKGETWVSSSAAVALMQEISRPPSPANDDAYTTREREVLRGILEGLTSKEIAAQLDISESSVKAILQKLFLKTGVRTRSQLVRVAMEMGEH